MQYPSWYFLITASMTQNLQTTLLFAFSATDKQKKELFLDSQQNCIHYHFKSVVAVGRAIVGSYLKTKVIVCCSLAAPRRDAQKGPWESATRKL
jgi:hypothetical protein